MRADMKPYPRYEPSGLAWLGAVPAGWRVAPGMSTFAEVPSGVPGPDDLVISPTSDVGPGRYEVHLAGAEGRVAAGHPLRVTGGLLPEYACAYIRSLDLLGAPPLAGRDGDLQLATLGRLPVLVPPSADQREIAAFLGRRRREIREAVAGKEELRSLLAELRRTILSRAVTWGVVPDVPRGPADLPGVESVPRHWRTRPWGRCLVPPTGGGISATRLKLRR